MDYSLFQAINGQSGRVHLVDQAFAILANGLPALIAVLVALLSVIPWRRRRLERRRAAVSATAAAALACWSTSPFEPGAGLSYAFRQASPPSPPSPIRADLD